MNAEPKRRQGSSRAFFGYLTLTSVLLGMARASSGFDPPAVLAFSLSVALFSSFGAVLGSLFGNPCAGAVVGIAALFVLGLATLMPVSDFGPPGPSKYDRLTMRPDQP